MEVRPVSSAVPEGCVAPGHVSVRSPIERFFRQFARPTGFAGAIAGRLMARKNGELNLAVVTRLEPGPEDRVLEVGFGPGLAIELLAARVPRGCIVGVDASSVMLRQALRRVRRAGVSKRVDLRSGCATSLPFANGAFERACSVNSLPFWPSAERGLAEIRRVLRPGGRLVLALRRRREGAGRFDRSARASSDERLDAIEALLARTGFRNATRTTREIAGESIAFFEAVC
jgi:SAM-dependent methyltransferase